MDIGKRIYYDIETGNIIVDTGEKSGYVVETSTQYEISIYPVLANRKEESFGILELEFGKYRQDFMECNGYRVNPETKLLEFSYPDENATTEEPVYQEPLSEQIKSLEERTSATEDALLSLLME